VSYERTQKGNPRLTIKQHVLPTRSISRFAGHDGNVDFYNQKTSAKLRIRPANHLFCAQRVWDESTEKVFMKGIEDAFQPIADRIIEATTVLTPQDSHIISMFHALWRLRAEAKVSPASDQPLIGLLPGKGFTKDEQEQLESKHLAYVSDGFNIPGRILTGSRIKTYVGRLCRNSIAWGIIRSKHGEFIVPDTFGALAVVPLSPTICLIGGTNNAVISKKKIAEINRIAWRESLEYCFARDFLECPA
jgi:hypothetical protein